MDIFSYYFFTRDVQHDGNHMEFWVAGMNVTMITAGYYVIRRLWMLLNSSAEEHIFFGFSGIFCILGISSVTRIYAGS